jgi:hypothetical protein
MQSSFSFAVQRVKMGVAKIVLTPHLASLKLQFGSAVEAQGLVCPDWLSPEKLNPAVSPVENILSSILSLCIEAGKKDSFSSAAGAETGAIKPSARATIGISFQLLFISASRVDFYLSRLLRLNLCAQTHYC